MDRELIANLEEKAKKIRRHIVRMIGEAGSGHPGGSLSSADIVTALYFNEMRIDPQFPQWPGRDRFVLSKGHAAPLLYAALAERGYFPADDLMTLRKMGSPLQGHPAMQKLQGVEMSTGSLGQGLSAANGMALAGKLNNMDYHVYVLLGDGEIQEGQVWEAAMAASHYKLDNVTVFLDHNKLQIDGFTRKVMSPEPLEEKWTSFGWNVQVIDGHNIEQILRALKQSYAGNGKPNIIIAETVKGKGVSFMEGEVDWHGSAPKPDQVEKALQELA
ncbi:MAG: transketolase [Clostridiales bacterium]|nr:transketolase [Clostridiales bacterium]MCF8022895.1 transketolase [Clostridiales bacterium]